MKNLLNKIEISVLIFISWLFNLLPISVQQVMASAGDTIKAGLKATNTEAGLDNTPLPALIGNLIKALLGVVGIIFLVYTIIGGIMYMTDGGDGKKVTKAKDIIKTALIGLIIVVVAYSLTTFVVTTIADATAGGGADKK